MESSRNVKKLKARQKWRKRSSVVIILRGDRGRMRSLQKLSDDSTTTSRSYNSTGSCSNSHVLVIRSDMDNTNSDEPRHKTEHKSKGLMSICLYLVTVNTLGRTFPWMSSPLFEPLEMSSMVEKLCELLIMLISFWIIFDYICDLLDKDKMKKIYLTRLGKLWFCIALGCTICLCICSTVQFANFHQHEDDRATEDLMVLYICGFCVLICRQAYNPGSKLQLPYMITEVFSSPELLFPIGNLVLALWPTTYQPIKSNPRYAHTAMFCCSILSVACSIMGLILKGQEEGVKLRRWGMMWWFYHPDPDPRPFGTLTDIYGLISTIYQCIFSTIQYACLLLHIDNPIQLCLLPTIFLVCLACSTSHRSHRTKGISVEWIFLLINIGLEISSATFEQLSSSSKPHYALYGMLLAITAVIISIWELFDKGKKDNVTWMRRGTKWWFYHRAPPYAPFGSLPDIYGLIGGVAQCIFSIVQYVCYLQHVDNPIQPLCLLPAIFYAFLAMSKTSEKCKTH